MKTIFLDKKNISLRLGRISSDDGMTFIEILIVVSLMTMISLALYQSLFHGMKVWDKVQQLVVEEDVVIFFDKFTQDIRQTYHHDIIGFDGVKQRVAFSTVVDVLPEEENAEYVPQLGRVEYGFDSSDKAIYRREANYSQATRGLWGAKRQLVLNINSFTVTYYYIVNGEGERFNAEVKDLIPSGVEIEVEIGDERGVRRMTKYIEIVIGGQG